MASKKFKSKKENRNITIYKIKNKLTTKTYKLNKINNNK